MKKGFQTFVKRGISVALAALLSVSMAACGSQDAAGNTGEDNGTEASEYVYVPEYFQIKTQEEAYINRSMLQGTGLYYSVSSYREETGEYLTSFRYVDSADTTKTEEMELKLDLEGYDTHMGDFFFDQESNLYVFWHAYPTQEDGEANYDSSTMYLTKYDNSMSGEQLWAQDIGSMLTDENNSYIQEAVVGKDGKIYASSNNVIYVMDGEGKYLKTIPTNTDWIHGMVSTEGGQVFMLQYGMKGLELVEIDTATDTLGESFGNLPDMNGRIRGGGEGKLLIAGTSKLYEYDMATQESAEVLAWIDSNIDGSYVQDFSILDNEKILLFYDDYEGEPELTLLTKTDASEVVQKEIITIATLHEGNSSLQRAAVAFNKRSDKYQIKIKHYIDNTTEWTENTYSDGLARMNADIVSDNCPDIIDLSYADMKNLAGKGALEDLTPYLEASTIANKEDFVPNVLQAFQIEGIQVTVPKYFNIATLLGKTSVVGTESGWTLTDIIALADANPEAQLMHYMNKGNALRLCLMFSSDSFIDYKTATCSFNSPEFIQVLEFANRFEEEYETDESFPSLIQSGKVLLSDASFGDVQEYQMYNLMFEDETTNIGYPTEDGSAGVFMNSSDMYGISAKSAHKDGAWAFIENILAEDGTDRYGWGFPSRTEMLDKLFEEAMTPEYQYDENGEMMYDEEGNPLEYPKTTWGYDDWDAEIYAATPKEVDEIKAMIDCAKLAAEGDNTIFEMISEEASAYFEGAKSAEETAQIIQSRVEIYVSENS